MILKSLKSLDILLYALAYRIRVLYINIYIRKVIVTDDSINKENE